MVDGLVKGATVVDLDGTLVSCNTLHVYISTALKHVSMSRRSAIVALLVARKLHLISHEKMKYKILSLAGRNMEIFNDFVKQVNGSRRPVVDTSLEDRRR